ncbi:hypothetical protein KPL76_02715 [Subtercola sp. PAMC28395]|nr:hypothetical protein [Subtercola sp. PAMC28395]QWT24340.1 hypothetical protein KPL76_02715 [Subtercola sp. PAMC28395]
MNVLDSARLLLEQSGGVQELMGLTVRELRQLIGVGAATAGRLVAVAELWRRAHDPPPGPVVATASDIARAIRAQREADAEFTLQSAGDVTGPVAPTPGAPDPVLDSPAIGPSVFSSRAVYLVITDAELRLRWVIAIATCESESIAVLASRVLHEVLFRGGAAFALAWVGDDDQPDQSEAHSLRDVLKLASATVGLTFLSALVLTSTDWHAL